MLVAAILYHIFADLLLEALIEVVHGSRQPRMERSIHVQVLAQLTLVPAAISIGSQQPHQNGLI